MTALDPTITKLAKAYGVATGFYNWRGSETQVSRESMAAVLAALDVDASTKEAAERSLDAFHDAKWRATLPPTVVARQDEGTEVEVHVNDGASVEVWVELEFGGQREVGQVENWTSPRIVDGIMRGQASFFVPGDLPLGYHRLLAVSDGVEAEALLIIAPQFLGFPYSVGEDRAWGWAVQLYSITSQLSAGMGDLADLGELAAWSAAEQGADYILINPLHAAEPVTPLEASPYLPSSRRFTNPLYLRVEQILEFAELDEAVKINYENTRRVLDAALVSTKTIDRDAVWEAKRAALIAVFNLRRDEARAAEFAQYRDRQGQSLVDFAIWCTLAERFGSDWSQWPSEFSHPGTDAVAEAARADAEKVRFYCWLQWQLDEQLAAAQQRAEESGMALGIMHDLAVGVNPNGADAWALADVFAKGVAVGSPPDAFNQLGQNWSQPPWRPDRLAACGYQPLRDMIADILRHSGGIRVDHVMGLFRLWWVPEGQPPTKGCYVSYDYDAMVGILTLEAARAGSLVVGEDLGTVEPWVRDYLTDRGVLGTSILWWEQDYDGDGSLLAPQRWREYCLASLTTHDLPPTTGFLASDHVYLREKLGLLSTDLETELANDRSERAGWLDKLREMGLLNANIADDTTDVEEIEQIVLALHAYLVLTRSRLIGPTLTDAVGERKAQNLPGTTDEYPNWRVPMTDVDGNLVRVEDLPGMPRVQRLAAQFADLNAAE